MITSLAHDDAPHRAIETFDVWAARALYDALGPARGASQIVNMVDINAWGILPDVAEQSGIGTGGCSFVPECGHGGFSMRIDKSVDEAEIGVLDTHVERVRALPGGLAACTVAPMHLDRGSSLTIPGI